jgi:uncharacterized protein (DUF2236 family)
MARIGAGLGVPNPPRTEAELTERINAYRPELAATAQARDAARFLLLHPPLPVIARAPYAVLAASAVSLLPGWARQQLRLPRLPVSETVLVRPAGHAMVHAIRWAITAPPAPPQSPRPRHLPRHQTARDARYYRLVRIATWHSSGSLPSAAIAAARTPSQTSPKP